MCLGKCRYRLYLKTVPQLAIQTLPERVEPIPRGPCLLSLHCTVGPRRGESGTPQRLLQEGDMLSRITYHMGSVAQNEEIMSDKNVTGKVRKYLEAETLGVGLKPDKGNLDDCENAGA
jgi:hypothetical protein